MVAEKNFRERLEHLAYLHGGGQVLAQKINVSYAVLRKWVRGQSEPTLSVLCRISEKTNVSLEWLVYGRPSINIEKALRQSVTALEEATLETGVKLSPEVKADVILAVMQISLQEGEEVAQQTTNVLKLLKRG